MSYQGAHIRRGLLDNISFQNEMDFLSLVAGSVGALCAWLPVFIATLLDWFATVPFQRGPRLQPDTESKDSLSLCMQSVRHIPFQAGRSFSCPQSLPGPQAAPWPDNLAVPLFS